MTQYTGTSMPDAGSDFSAWKQARISDPLLRNISCAEELFGGVMLSDGGKPMPTDLAKHPTHGNCKDCGRKLKRTYIAFAGDWTPLRYCETCEDVNKRSITERMAGVEQYKQPVKPRAEVDLDAA